MTQPGPDKPNAHEFVDTLYDIALDPGSLPSFIETWCDAGLDSQEARQMVENFDRFDEAHQTHLRRADVFLKRGAQAEAAPDFAAMLAPFANLAAFIVDADLSVVAANQGAQQTFGLTSLMAVRDAGLARDTKQTLVDCLRKTVSAKMPVQHLLKVTDGTDASASVFQIRQIAAPTPSGAPLVLVVTTNYHWNAALGQKLGDVFQLTPAEHGVVRALVEGKNTKAVAAERGTSEGTVRGQIKSVLAKMNARTQSEVIRLVLSMRDVSPGQDALAVDDTSARQTASKSWWQGEVWKPFQSLTLPDGRRMDYHVMGPPGGAPVLYSHIGYCLARWHEPMLRLLYKHNLRIICPIRPGYGMSDDLDPSADILETLRHDTLFLLNHLGIDKLPYLTQGSDINLAVDFTHAHPEIITEIIGVCARLPLRGDAYFSLMGKWHRFFISTAQHAPHLLLFTIKAAISLSRRIGVKNMYFKTQKGSPADMAIQHDTHLTEVLVSNCELWVGPETDGAQAYVMEIVACESDWSHKLHEIKDTKIWFMNGAEDPAVNADMIDAYRNSYPWIDIEVLQNAGQMLLFQHFDYLLPKVAKAAADARAL